jgi:hypothetical protein
MGELFWRDTSAFVWKDLTDFEWDDDGVDGFMFIVFSQLFPKIEFDAITLD